MSAAEDTTGAAAAPVESQRARGWRLAVWVIAGVALVVLVVFVARGGDKAPAKDSAPAP